MGVEARLSVASIDTPGGGSARGDAAASPPGSGEPRVISGRNVLVARLLLALAQAAALYLLAEAATPPRTWPATQATVFDPLVVVFSFVPPMLLVGLGRLSPRPLAIWAVVAVVLVSGLGFHDAARERAPAWASQDTLWPYPPLWLALGAALFIAHVLVVDALSQRRLVAPYPRHFDTAWKLAVQAAFAAAFVGVFWGVLVLGAGLFKLVDIDLFQRLLSKRWFIFPATTLALALAVHATDVQPGLIRGIRSVALALFSWLLPVLTVILLGFLGSLPFVSLAPLWKTHFATALLLTAAAMLIVLINSSYQDGASEQTRSAFKRRAASLGALELVPLVALAAWALSLRVGQHGWTTQRITAAAMIVLAACYALGYALAVLRSPTWLKYIETTNFAAAYLALALVAALFSPLADPARLMVADQLARLRAGAVSAEKFDFIALKFDGARWGAAALAELARGGGGRDADLVAARAKLALAATSRTPLDAPSAADRVAVFPPGRSLPPHLVEDAFDKAGVTPACLRFGTSCTARYVSLTPDRDSILFFDPVGPYSYLLDNPDGQPWRIVAKIEARCARASPQTGTDPLRTLPHELPDLQIGERHYLLNPYWNERC
jgi:hypothetical protein